MTTQHVCLDQSYVRLSVVLAAVFYLLKRQTKFVADDNLFCVILQRK